MVSNDHVFKLPHLTLGSIFVGGVENLLESRFGLYFGVDD